MKIIGKNSLIHWIKIPFTIYVIGFILSSLWIFAQMVTYMLTGEFNQFISNSNWNSTINQEVIEKEFIQFRYPFTQMALSTESSTEGILLAFLGLFSFCFILIYMLSIVFKLSKDEIFTNSIIQNLKSAGFGLILFGIATLLIDITDGFSHHYKSYDLTPPFFYLLFGLILIFIKEIFVKARKIQEENDLTI